ncbi:Glycosyltransferase involved in cell wall bisynthesis [Geodermatophilus amargosae]|uniref:Glycosyltransferase involved in cell wall bisynthesis n=1 Tax=Geodermatophilus amargosae TaxID=1296565 RepID=A0A1I6X799_9ACTN|nr:glycosyltransferase family 1 protein [Geodermatophilus amargosae]SFT34006.1 Glycosyltransferase involved in cell wall bisynthesis [Geodermatophilus amargosae]
MPELLVNGAFVGQRVTGQQRYATEVSAELVRRHSGRLLRPPPAVRSRAALSHLWAHTALPARSLRGDLVSMTSRSPVVARRHTVVVHDLFVLQHPEWYSARYVRTHAPVLTAQLRTAGGLVAVSEPVARELRRLYPRARVTVAPNAPSEVFRRASGAALPDAVRAVLDAPGVEGFLFAVGSLDPRKNFGRLVEAYQALPAAVRATFPLVIAGGGSAVFAEAAVGPTPQVHWIGYVDDPGLASLYATATAVVVPSLDEGFGLPVVEALTAGGRLAVSDIPAFRWVAGDSVRYFRPDEVQDITRALQAALYEPVRPAGCPVPPTRFSWEASADVIAAFAREA